MNFFIDLIASTSFYISPLLLGYILTSYLPRIKGLFVSFALGVITLYLGGAIVLTLSNIFGNQELGLSIIRYAVLALPILALGNFLLGFRDNILQIRIIYREKKNDIFSYLLLLVFTGFTYFVVWKNMTPYPLALNWDIYEHITAANQIAKGQFAFLPSFLSDTFTFNGYTTVFHYLLSIPKIVFNTNLLGVYWWLEYWHYLITTLVIYSLSKYLFKNRAVALLSGIVGALTFESSIAYTNLFLIPQTFTSIMAVGLLTSLLKNLNNGEQIIHKFILFIVGAIFLVANHFIIGSAAVVALIGFFLIAFHTKIKPILTLAFFASVVILCMSIFLGLHNNIVLTDREEATHFALTPYQKLEVLFNWYSFTLPIFLPLGTFAIYRYFYNRALKVFPIAAITTLAVSLAPLSYFLKFYVLGHYFVHIVIVAGILYMLRGLNKIQIGVASTALIISIFVIFYFNQISYTNNLYSFGTHSHISQKEINAALWLERYYKNSNALIISDPSTQYIFEAISGINSQGGAYTSVETREILGSLLDIKSQDEIYHNLTSIKDLNNDPVDKRLLVLSGRYFTWTGYAKDWRQSFFYNVWTPQSIKLSNLSYINFLTNDPRFQVIYQNDEIIILEIK